MRLVDQVNEVKVAVWEFAFLSAKTFCGGPLSPCFGVFTYDGVYMTQYMMGFDGSKWSKSHLLGNFGGWEFNETPIKFFG